jgi:integrase
MRKTLKDVEVRKLTDGTTSYIFSKRLNPAKGVYAGFSDRFKLKLIAGTDAEATVEAKKLAERLEQLQRVCLRDSRGLIVSSIEMNQAAATWFEVINHIDLAVLHQDSKKTYTKASFDAKEYLQIICDCIVEHWEHPELDHEGGYRVWLSPFGALLLSLLKEGRPSQKFGETFDIYLRQTNRAHLSTNNRAVATPARFLTDFTSIVGDKAVEDISRRDVERFISKRLDMGVKTTTVRREIAGLRAIWTQVANALEIQTRNPFERQPIHGLGADSIERYPLQADEMQAVLRMAEGQFQKRPLSYAPALLAIATLTGARLSEVHGLVLEDFVEESGILWIRLNGKRESLKTKNSQRPIPVLPVLRLWLDRFFNSRGGPVLANSASANCLKYLKRLDINSKGFTIHGLRHGFKQLLVEVDCPGNLTDELLGWSQQGMSKNYGFTTVTQSKIEYMTKAYAKILPSA